VSYCEALGGVLAPLLAVSIATEGNAEVGNSNESRTRDEVGVANRKLEIGKNRFFAIFSPQVFGEVAEWLKAALC
jgi:hypothetical protein